ncbi:MAG: TIGR00730 family Rossman fold protein [Thermomicrobiales bacterium]
MTDPDSSGAANGKGLALASICVFCGSNVGSRQAYAAAAERLGAFLAASGIRLVYGGGRVGLMGVVASAALAAGGEVVGVIPEALARREVAHESLTELHVVETMHERKAKMASLADGFIALPGGFGTFEELCEILTWSQLGLHRKPIGIVDVHGFYDGLIALFDHAVDEGFLRPDHRALVIHDDDAARLLARMRAFRPPVTTKWLDPDQT